MHLSLQSIQVYMKQKDWIIQVHTTAYGKCKFTVSALWNQCSQCRNLFESLFSSVRSENSHCTNLYHSLLAIETYSIKITEAWYVPLVKGVSSAHKCSYYSAVLKYSLGYTTTYKAHSCFIKEKAWNKLYGLLIRNIKGNQVQFI